MPISYKRYSWQTRIQWTLKDAQQTGQAYLTTRQLIIRCGDALPGGDNMRQALTYAVEHGLVERLQRGLYALPEEAEV